jgi:CelD/BcsL family acetyltransferase involved in cellulose biosynthesis
MPAETSLSAAGVVRVEVYNGPLDALRAAFDTLADPTHPGAAFRSYAWIATWWKHFSYRRAPHVLVARTAGETVGLLPLYRQHGTLSGPLRLMGDGIVGSDYLGPIARLGYAPEVTRAFAAALAPTACDLDWLDSDEGFTRTLLALPAAVSVARGPSPSVRVAGTFSRYLDGLPHGTGAQWRRRARWLERRPGFAFEVVMGESAVARHLPTFLELHRKRWAVDGGSQAIDSRGIEAFHVEAARALARIGWARLYLLHVEGAVRAALYAFRHGDRLVFYQSGLDPEWRARSVGSVLLGRVIEEAFLDELSEFDFLHGSEPYKLRWANATRQLMRVRLRGTSAAAWLRDRAEATWARIYGLGKAAVPPAALAWAARARRRALAEWAWR